MTRLLNFTLKKAKFIVIILLALVFVACEGTTTVTESTSSLSTTETTMSKIEILEAALESINLPIEISEDIELPTTITVGDNQVSASWNSTASKVIDNTGQITPNVADKTATLVVTLEFEGEQLSDSFTVTVKGNEAFLVLYAVLNSKVELPQTAITEDIVLPTEYVIDNKTVSAMWTSSDPTSLSNSGVVTLKEYPVFITLTLKLTYMDIIQEETFNITVAQDPDTLPLNSWHLAPVYTGAIENEASKPGTPNCFPGAIYRKVVSSKDYWLGIEATITLPQFTPDPERYDDTKQNYYLDNSSIYMGGHSYYESDVGIAWMIGHTD